MKVKHSNTAIQNKAFTYYIKDYDARKRIYTLENPLTKEIKQIAKDEFDKIYGSSLGAEPAAKKRR